MALLVRTKKPGPIKPTPNPYPTRFQRWKHGFPLSFILLLILVFFLRFYPPFFNYIQQKLFEISSIVQSVFMIPLNEASTILKETSSLISLKDENKRLRSETKHLKEKLQSLIPLQHENKNLRQQLNIASTLENLPITSKVLASPYDGLHFFLVIATGQKDNIEEGQAVIVSEGVVGRIEKIGRHVSRVLLLNDFDSRIPVITVNSEQKAILAGDESSLPILVYITDSRKVQKGEQVITSGMGGIFPPGIPVGVIDTIANGKITVRPYVNLKNLDWVTILKSPSKDYLKELKETLEGE